MLQRNFELLFFYYFLFTLYRNEEVAIQPYDEPSIAVTLNPSNLFNSMIYPFTRMVIYGTIWYQGK